MGKKQNCYNKRYDFEHKPKPNKDKEFHKFVLDTNMIISLSQYENNKDAFLNNPNIKDNFKFNIQAVYSIIRNEFEKQKKSVLFYITDTVFKELNPSIDPLSNMFVTKYIDGTLSGDGKRKAMKRFLYSSLEKSVDNEQLFNENSLRDRIIMAESALFNMVLITGNYHDFIGEQKFDKIRKKLLKVNDEYYNSFKQTCDESYPITPSEFVEEYNKIINYEKKKQHGK